MSTISFVHWLRSTKKREPAIEWRILLWWVIPAQLFQRFETQRGCAQAFLWFVNAWVLWSMMSSIMAPDILLGGWLTLCYRAGHGHAWTCKEHTKNGDVLLFAYRLLDFAADKLHWPSLYLLSSGLNIFLSTSVDYIRLKLHQKTKTGDASCLYEKVRESNTCGILSVWRG